MSKTIYIGGRLESKEKGNVVTGANAILDDTKGKKQNVINKETDDELARLEQSKQDNLNFDNTPTEDSTNPVTSGGVYTAEKALSDAIEAILLLIPSAATELNKLVDTNTMNSSISTATATFRGTYNAVSDLGLTYQATHAQIEAALDALGLTADNNDFAFVQIPVSDQSQDIAKTERFKFNGTNWLYEYDLNTSGFTAAQWAAINSGITVALVTKLSDLPTAAALQLAFNAKQDTLTFDNEPTALSQNPVTSGGIYTAIQAVATALSDYSTTTDGRLDVLEGLVPTEASSSNKLTDKAYVDGLIQAITELIPAEADTTNQLADKAYVLAQILAATPAFKGQYVILAELQAVASPKAGDLGIVRTKDSDGMDVFTVYQYLSNAWNVFCSLSYHPQTKPATTGTTGDYPYNGMGRVELAKNMVNTGTDLEPVMVNQLTQDMFYKGAVGSRVPNTNTIFVIRYDYVLAENITIPDNCVLEFEGGSISGAYTLTGANTKAKGLAEALLSGGVIIAGTWDVDSLVLPKNTDVTALVQKMLDLFGYVHFGVGTYYVSDTIVIRNSNSVISGCGKGRSIIKPSVSVQSSIPVMFKTLLPGEEGTSGSAYYIVGETIIKNICIDGRVDESTIMLDAAMLINGASSIISKVKIVAVNEYGINIGCWCNRIEDCVISFYTGKGIVTYDQPCNNLVISKCRIESGEYGIYLTNGNNIIVRDNCIEGNTLTDIYAKVCSGLIIDGNYFEGSPVISKNNVYIQNENENPVGLSDDVRAHIILTANNTTNNAIISIGTINSVQNVTITNNYVEGTSGQLSKRLCAASSCIGSLTILNNYARQDITVLELMDIARTKYANLKVLNNYKQSEGNVLNPVAITLKDNLTAYYGSPTIVGDVKLDKYGEMASIGDNINQWGCLGSSNVSISTQEIYELKPNKYIIRSSSIKI